MSLFQKHFGLKYKGELYFHKELEKVRKETKKDFLRLKQSLASKPAIGEGPVHRHQPPSPQALGRTSPGEREHISQASPRKPSASPQAKGLGAPDAAPLQEALRGEGCFPGPGEAAAPVKPRPFRPQDFYMRSSAYLRQPPQKKPPVIAPGAGTSRAVALLPPPATPLKLRAHPGRGSPQTTASRPVPDLVRGRDPGREVAQPAEVRKAKQRRTSSTPSEDSDAEAAGRRGRVKVLTHLFREVCERQEAARPDASKTDRGSLLPSAALEAGPALLPARVIPTSIQEIIASLQSEAQRASDQTIKELIQSVLGQDYDLKMEVGEPQPE